MKVKICGLTKVEHVEACVKHGSDYCGFILNYPKSHRYIQFEKAKELISIERGKTKTLLSSLIVRFDIYLPGEFNPDTPSGTILSVITAKVIF